MDEPAVTLRVGAATRPHADAPPSPEARPGVGHFDESQAAAVAARGDVVRVLGAPGTGKSRVAVAAIRARIESGEARPDQLVLISATRLGAAAARDAVTADLATATTEPLARTMASLGFAILRQHAVLQGSPSPRLLSGAEQDVVLGELLAGHRSDGTGPTWPDSLQAALTTRAFREELRDLLMRAIEHGVTPAGLAELGQRTGRPEWVAAADVAREYDEVTALARPGAYDPSWVLAAAAELLEADGEARERVRRDLRAVVVDDAQELTAPGARLLRALTGDGVDLVLIGDPDAGVQGFRGGDPSHLMEDWPGRPGTTLVLAGGHRLPQSVHAAAARVTSRIAAIGGAPQRAASPAEGDGGIAAHVLHSGAQEAAFIAHLLRTAHLREGIAWRDLAIVVRGASRQATMRRILAARGVPVIGDAHRVALRDEPAVLPLLELLALVVGLSGDQPAPVRSEQVVDLLGSPLIAADAVVVRRLRRALRQDEVAGGGARSSDELLAAALLEPTRLEALGADVEPLHRLARVLEAGRAAAQVDPAGGWAPGVSAESVLWAIWEASGVAPRWKAAALAGGSSGERADHALDVVVALFDAAASHQDSLPASGPDSFLDAIASQTVAADSLSARRPDPDAVALLTPQTAAGGEWDTVVVAGVQEGVWPDLRLRGSLLGSTALVDLVTGRDDRGVGAAEAVRHDEARLFHTAITRARRRVVVTAVATDEDQPSIFLDLADPLDDPFATRPVSETPPPFDLTGVVARLRQQLAGDDEAAAARSAVRLAELREAGVAGADPATWWSLRTVSDDRPVRAMEQPVPVSPSKVQSFSECGLRWLLTSSGGEGPSSVSMEVGTLVHDLAATLGDAGEDALAAELERRWPELGLPPGWVSEQKRVRAARMVHWMAAYHQRAASEGWRPVAVEEPFRVELGRAVLRGSVDRLESDEQGRLRVIDYKTGASAPTQAEVAAHPQLGSYQVAVAEGGFEQHGQVSAGAALVQLGKAYTSGKAVQEQPPIGDSDAPRQFHDLLADTAEGMSRPTFVAQPEDNRCRICPVRSSCPAHEEGGRLT